MKPKNEQLRQNILKATTELLITEGVAGTSTLQVAKRIHATQSNLYSYFKNKEDLLIQTFTYHQAAYIEAIQSGWTNDLALIPVAKLLVKNILVFGMEHSDSLKVILLMRQQPKLRSLLPKIEDDAFFTALFTQLEHFQQQGIIKPLSTQFLAENIFSITVNFILGREAEPEQFKDISVADVQQLALDLVLSVKGQQLNV